MQANPEHASQPTPLTKWFRIPASKCLAHNPGHAVQRWFQTEMTIGKNLQSIIAASAIGLGALSPQQSEGLQLTQGVGAVGNDITVPVDLTNNDSGVSYNSLVLDSGLANLLFSAYGVADLYGNDFQSFLNSGDFGYDISSGDVKNGWNADTNSDGTIGIQQGEFGGEPFDTDKTMTGNYFFLKSLLDAENDGNDNYTFHLLSDAQNEANFGSPLTKKSIVGSSLNNDFAQAEGQGASNFFAQGESYALVPTDFHPQIPEPSSYGLLLGLGALGGAVLRRRNRAFAEFQTP